MLIARRHMIDRLRRKQTRPTTQDYCPSLGDGPNQTEDPKEIRAELKVRMERLSELQKEVVARTYFQGSPSKRRLSNLEPLGP